MILAFCRLSSSAFLVRIVYAPTPAKPSPTRKAPEIAKSIFHRIFMAWTSDGVDTTCEVEILQSRLPFSKRGGNPLGGVRADRDCFGWLAMTMNCCDRAGGARAEAILRDIAIEGGRVCHYRDCAWSI